LKNIKEVILIILIVVAVAAGGWFFLLKNTAVASRTTAQDILFQEKIAKKKAEEIFSREEKDKNGLKQSVDKVMEDVKALEAEYIAIKRQKDSISKKINNLKTVTQQANRKIEQTTANLEDLKKRIANIVKDTLNLTDDLDLAEKTTNALKERLEDYPKKPESYYEETAVAAGEQEYYQEDEDRYEEYEQTYQPEYEEVVREQVESYAPAGSAPELVGEILTINREFDFIVVNLGNRDGMEEGMLIDIYRGETLLGQAVIETARENISAAAITDKEKLSHMRPGDIVYTVASI